MDNLKTLIKLFSYFLISILIYFTTNQYIQKEEEIKLTQKYDTTSDYMKKNILSLISDKKNATLSIALSFIENKLIIDALIKNNHSSINLKELSSQLKQYTKFKNVWFQVINKEGDSFYRSWSNNKNDSLLFRPDVRKIFKTNKIQTTISVGKYDMTFKSMVPILTENKLIGIFEVITHFNSISKTLEKEKIDSIFFAHKRYKTNLVYPFTKQFLGDYYIANLNAKDSIINLIKNKGIEEVLKIKDYEIIDKKIVVSQKILDPEKNIIGYVVMTKKLEDIDISSIISDKKNSIKDLILFLILIGIFFLALNYYFYLKKINIEKKRAQTILDSQKNIIVITNGEKIQNCNAQLFEFFDEFKNLKQFKQKYNCICDRFIEMDDNNYLVDKDYDGKNWAEYILANDNQKFKAAIERHGKIHHFTLNVNLSNLEEHIPYIIVTLTDITNEIENNRIHMEKDRLLFQQNKMASMGEMLNNIAHQWRQPLSAISSITSSLKLKNEIKILEENEIDNICENILKHTNYLSHTIEDFRNFFKDKKDKEVFDIKTSLNESINLLKARLKDANIQIIIEINNKIEIYSFKNEFQQAILNILNNSIDALTKEQDDEKIIFISFENDTLLIKDSAGGVESSIIDKIFEPYFTTKHQSQGTGIGLYMSQEILTKHMNCKINVSNKIFNYKGKDYYGLSFEIKFDKNLLKLS